MNQSKTEAVRGIERKENKTKSSHILQIEENLDVPFWERKHKQTRRVHQELAKRPDGAPCGRGSKKVEVGTTPEGKSRFSLSPFHEMKDGLA